MFFLYLRLMKEHCYDSLQYTELDLQPHWTQVKYDSLQYTELDLQLHRTQVKYDSVQYTELDLQLHWTQVKYEFTVYRVRFTASLDTGKI